MSMKTMTCPHCGAECSVWRNGNRCCPNCGKTFSVNCFAVRAVRQPDGISCGWATTLWLLRKFGALDVPPEKLREELNVDAKHGAKSVLRKIVSRCGGGIEGTRPPAMFAGLKKRGIVVKSARGTGAFSDYTNYLDKTFEAGGYGVCLLNTYYPHWMGIDKDSNGNLRLMDPMKGYCPFNERIDEYRKANPKASFLVFGFIKR